MRETLTTNALSRAAAQLKANGVTKHETTFIIHATESRSREICAMFGVESRPDHAGEQRVGHYLVVTE